MFPSGAGCKTAATKLSAFQKWLSEGVTQNVDPINSPEMMETVWARQVAYADQHLNDHEVHLMRKIQRLLYIPHKKFIGAKLRAKEPST